MLTPFLNFSKLLTNNIENRENNIHIKKAVVYKQLFEFKSNLNCNMIRDLKPKASTMINFHNQNFLYVLLQKPIMTKFIEVKNEELLESLH